MGKRGPTTAAVKAANQRKRSRAKRFPWEKKGLSRAARVVAFCEWLPITAGIHAGKRLLLRDWQKAIIEAVYATNAEGLRTVRTALISLPRKNGKTALAAALALCHLLGPESEPRGQVFSAASDREQAAIIYREMESIILSVPEFADRCHVQSFHKTITDTVTGSTYKALTSDGRKAHGLSPSFVVYDELAQSHNRELYDNLSTGGGARREPLLFAISTQSPDPHHVMSELCDYSLKIQDGTLPFDPAFYGCVYQAPMDADPWDEGTWFGCNPALDDFRSLEEMRAFAEQAKKIPAKEAAFRNLYLNQRVDAAARWVSPADFAACVGEMPDLTGRECYGGLDLSSTQDLSALSLVFAPQRADEPFHVLAYAWCPRASIKRRSKTDRVPYDLWVKENHVEATPGVTVDYNYILNRIDSIHKQFKLKGILFDRWGSARITKDLEDKGLTILEFGQGFQSFSAPTKELEKLILEKKIVFPENPALAWCFSNVICESDAAGNLKPSKKRSREKIDMAVATIMALDGAIRNQQKDITPSINWI